MKRRNSIAILCSALFCFGLVLSGCAKKAPVPGDSSLDNVTATWSVTFDSQGGSAVETQTVKDGELAVRPTDPTKQDYEFLGWYEDCQILSRFRNWLGKWTRWKRQRRRHNLEPNW